MWIAILVFATSGIGLRVPDAYLQIGPFENRVICESAIVGLKVDSENGKTRDVLRFAKCIPTKILSYTEGK